MLRFVLAYKYEMSIYNNKLSVFPPWPLSLDPSSSSIPLMHLPYVGHGP
jgi:hypothetical protein